ncbi:MAG TPA: hypothetical protein PKN48_06030 [Bacteroidales bacterium]|nr:hypothetical protein [Bacteroidales bacterium]
MKKKVTIVFASGTIKEIEFDDNMTSSLTADYKNFLKNGNPQYSRVTTGSSHVEVIVDLRRVDAIIC